MRTIRAFAAMSLVAAFLACKPEAAEFTAADEMAVRAAFDNTPGLVMKGDWPAWAAQFAENAFIYPPNATAVVGRAALQQWGTTYPPIDSLSFSNIQIVGSEDMAYGTSNFHIKLKDPAIPADNGKQLCVFKKNAGKWEGMGCVFNSDTPLPMPAMPPGKKM